MKQHELDAFNQEAQDLVQRCKDWEGHGGYAPHEGLQKEMRSWLSRVDPSHTSTLALWGFVTGYFIEGLDHNKKKPSPVDLKCIIRYLDTLATVSEELFFTTKEDPETQIKYCPIYDSLMETFEMLQSDPDEPPNKVLTYLVEHNAWKPSELLVHLKTMEPEQIEYMSGIKDEYAHFDEIASGRLINALLPVLTSSQWKPESHPIYSDIWKIMYLLHIPPLGIKDGAAEVDMSTLVTVSRLAEAFPQTTPHALYFYMQQSESRETLSQHVINSFLPIQLLEINRNDLLESLIYLTHQSSTLPSYTYAIEQLHACHPQLMQLVDFHTSLYENHKEALAQSHIMHERFHQLVHANSMTHGPSLYPLPIV